MILIVASTALVQASGIQSNTTFSQGGNATATTTFRSIDGFDALTHIVTPGGFSNNNIVSQYEGAEQETNLLISSGIEIGSATQLTVYFPDFSRGVNLFGVVGTEQTIEKFFDRSPFFFSSHETDSNTLRDISEAQQFLIFSQTTLQSYDNFRSTISPTQIIAVKGDIGVGAVFPNNLVSNGSFESGFSHWTTFSGHVSDILQVRSTQPTGVGFNDGSPVSPPDGGNWAYIAKTNTTRQAYLYQTIDIGSSTGTFSTDDLLTFNFKAVFNAIATSRLFQSNVIFYRNGAVLKNLIYRVSGMGIPTAPTGSAVASLPLKLITLSATEDVITSVSRDLRADLELATIAFDRMDLWFIFDTSSGNTSVLLDDVQLNANILTNELKRTSEFGHILTTNPTTSGFPFTVSGSDNIIIIDLTPPFFDEVSPGSGTTFNPTTSPVTFHIKDVSSALNQGSIDAFIDNVQVVNNGSVVLSPPWATGLKTVLAPNDIAYTFTRTPPFQQQSTVTVSGTFSDFATVSNENTQFYQFQILGSGSLNAMITGDADGTAPLITPVEPVALQTNVSPNTAIVWTTADDASGVDTTKTRLLINGDVVLQNEIATNGTFFSTANSNLGFDYIYIPNQPFGFGETVTGTIMAADFSTTGPNTGTLTYEFTTVFDDSLHITNFFMATEESILLTTGTVARVDVEDFTYGVASGTTYITVNGHTPAPLLTTVTGSLPPFLRFEFPLQPEVDFRSDIEIFVHAENQFPGSYPVVKEETFVLRPGYDAYWPNKSKYPEGGPETRFPHITNISVLTEIKNYAVNYALGSEFFSFLTDNVSRKDLGASITSNIEIADLPASLNVLNTFFEYGKTITLEFSAMDLEGNFMSFTHTFTIEPHP
jgi:hypothetical protein